MRKRSLQEDFTIAEVKRDSEKRQHVEVDLRMR
jgi:hypothetical protein